MKKKKTQPNRLDSRTILSQVKQKGRNIDNTPLSRVYGCLLHLFTLGLLLFGLCHPSPANFIFRSFATKFSSASSVDLTLDYWVQPSSILRVFAYTIGFLLSVIFLLKSYIVGLVLYQILLSLAQWIIVLYQLARILISFSFYGCARVVEKTHDIVTHLPFAMSNKDAVILRSLMKYATSYKEWKSIAIAVDVAEGKEDWKREVSDDEPFDCEQLVQNIERLNEALTKGNVHQLIYQLTACIKRDKLGIDTPQLHLECEGTKKIIELYNRKVVECLQYVCRAQADDFDTDQKIRFFKNLKKSYGSTALCLSGGGAIAMYHMGVILALMEEDLLPRVVSGSSGGSIAAAMLACKTNKELVEETFVPDISTRFADEGIVWFPPIWEQIRSFLKTGFLVDCSSFERTTQQYYSDPLNSYEKTHYFTFQDAYEKTGRQVSIAVSASAVTGSKGPRKLLLNHINTPNVLLWSAVAVSCSLPGIMKGKQLMARDSSGSIVPFLSIGKEWIDGSMYADVPFENMATCFNLSNFIVSQVNPHVVPFLTKDIDTPGSRVNIFRTLENILSADIRHRLAMLAKMGMFPRIYGQEISHWFQQNYRGRVTIVPNFIFAESIGLKAILNPTYEDMERYIAGGRKATWPKLSYIRHLCKIEKCLDACIDQAYAATPGRIKLYPTWLNPKRPSQPFENEDNCDQHLHQS